MTYEELTKHLEDPSFDEGQFIDFKAEIEQHNENELAKDISSFANAQGGRIFIGIKNNKEFKNDPINYPIRGWESMNSEDLSNSTRNKLSNFLSHSLHFTVNPVNIPDKNYPVLIIEISKSTTICGYRKKLNSSFEFWHRVDTQNVPTSMAQIIEKSLGSHHYKEQLNISKEFANLLNQRIINICISVQISYGKSGAIKFMELIDDASIKKINSSIEQVVYTSEIAYANLASLAFLSANIQTDLKQLAISLTNKLAEITARASIWRCCDNKLNLYKRIENIQIFNPLKDFHDGSNTLIGYYHSLQHIIKDVDKKIIQLEVSS